MKKNPGTFYITEHYKNSPCMLVALDKVQPGQLDMLITASWQNRVGKGLLRDWQENGANKKHLP